MYQRLETHQKHMENTKIEDQGVIKMWLKVRDEHVTCQSHITFRFAVAHTI